MISKKLFTMHLVQIQTIIIKEITRFSRIWIQTIIPPIITTALYFTIFGNLLGRHIPDMDGYDYMSFIVPGLIMMTIINNSYANVVTAFFSAKFQRQIEELLVSPTPNIIILLGYLFGGIIRGMLIGTIVMAESLLFADINISHPLLMIATAVLTALLFSLGGFINAMYAEKFDDANLVPTFILGPLTYLGGIFYSIKLIPHFWQTVSLGNPILYMVNAFRYSFLGISDININIAYSIIISADVLLFTCALILLNRGYGIRS